ncbi:MAG: CRISPR-associated protein Cas4 [Bacteroidetes bacterium]|nr:CRISPR-associated protein Cas4 [Bacteroidota bacterium]
MISDDDIESILNGTLIWYYTMCPREAWLMAHRITGDQDNEFMELGRVISENSYARDHHEPDFDGIKPDFIREKESGTVIVEVKKSTRFLEATRFQLLFYLYQLSGESKLLTGEIRVPEEKYVESVELTELKKLELEDLIGMLTELIRQPKPPVPELKKFCSKCAYQMYCWSVE